MDISSGEEEKTNKQDSDPVTWDLSKDATLC